MRARARGLRGPLLLLLCTWLGSAPAAPLDPTPEETAALESLGTRLPTGKLLWVRGNEIYYSPISNFAPQAVSTSGIPETHPRWSPDGTKVLFAREPAGVWVMNADFSDPVQVMPGATTPSWTRDGKQITAIDASNPQQVRQYELATGNDVVIYDSADAAYAGGVAAGDQLEQAAELRNGGRFLLTFTPDRGHASYIVDLQEHVYISNSQMDGGDCGPAWAPDGSSVLSTARTGDRPVRQAIFNATAATIGTSEYLVGIGTVCSCPYYVHGERFSNDGQWIAMGGLNNSTSNREIYVWKVGDPEEDVVRVTFESSEDMLPSLYVAPSGPCSDADGDGFGEGDGCLGPDCDDARAEAHPGAVERCNGLDDDCNGAADEAWASLGTACTVGLGACQADGVKVCTADESGVACDASPGAPEEEACDGLGDEDCDGTIDNGCACTGDEERACYGGAAGTAGVGACQEGTQSCSGGLWGECVGQVLPQTEQCGDGADNDCDGLVDGADGDCAAAVPPEGDGGVPSPDGGGIETGSGAFDATGGSLVGSCAYRASTGCSALWLVLAPAVLWWRRRRRGEGR